MSPTRILTTSAAVAAVVLVVVCAFVLTHAPKPMSGSTMISPTPRAAMVPPTATTGLPASPSSVAIQTATLRPTGPGPMASVPPTTVNPLSRIHNASPSSVPLFASITFTGPTTYDQAEAVLATVATTPYGENCDGMPRTPFPADEPHTLFEASHLLLISYPTWNQLLQIAAASAVISVDGTPLYPCP